MVGSLNNIAPGNVVKLHVGSRSLLAAIVVCGDVEQLPQAYIASMACALA